MEEVVFYFAYGSMTNPTSLQRRGINPTSSQPAMLQGYRLAFNLGGMANLLPDSDSSTHGILHCITPAMFEALHAIEANYDVLEVPVVPYEPVASSSSHASSTMHVSLGVSSASTSGCASVSDDNGASAAAGSSNSSADGSQQQQQTVAAKTFIVPQQHLRQLEVEHPEWHTSLPSERYVTIITAGLRHFGAAPAWVEAVAATPFAPSRNPEQYVRLPPPADPASLRTYSVQELAVHKGKIEDAKAIFAMGPKVVEVDLSAKPDGPFTKIIRSHMTGRDHTFGLCMNLYEPRLAALAGPDDVTEEHIAWAEDMCMEWTSKHGYPMRQIGWLVKDGGSSLPSQSSQPQLEASEKQ